MYNRKRQRRQAVASYAQNIWGGNNNNSNQSTTSPIPGTNNPHTHLDVMGRKSTAQPRPVLKIPPKGIGPIAEPNQNDVLCGRGGRINSHSGNIQFREVIHSHKKEYLAPSTKKLAKAHIAAALVNDIRSMVPPGRFLKAERENGLWYDIGDAKAIKKTGQALREDAPDIRDEIDGGSSGDEKPRSNSKSPKNTKSTVSVPNQDQQRLPNTDANHQGLMTAEECQAQIAMPPPMQQQQQQQQANTTMTFPALSIPIQVPPLSAYQQQQQQLRQQQQQQQFQRNNFHTTANAPVSRQAMAMLKADGRGSSNNVAFGREFHPPASTFGGSDNTMSSISGLTNPLSSNMGGLSSNMGLGGLASNMMGHPSMMGSAHNNTTNNSNNATTMISPTTENSARGVAVGGPSKRAQLLRNESMRLSQLVKAESYRRNSSKMSDLTASVRTLGRSLSFSDMNSIAETGGAWSRAIMEGDEEMLDACDGNSLLSGGGMSKFSVGSSSRMMMSGGANNSLAGGSMGASLRGGVSVSAMSVASNSTSGSSGKWAALLQEGCDDDQTLGTMSVMSADVVALDLASSSFRYDGQHSSSS